MSLLSDGGNSGIAVYGNRISIPFAGVSLSTLADTATATSDTINNSGSRYPECLIQINIAGTAAATAWLDPRLLVSTDKGVTFQTYENGFILPPIVLTVTPIIYCARILIPEYFRLAIRNVTGAVLTAGTAFYQGVRR